MKPDYLERYVKSLPVFAIKSDRFDLNLIKSCSLFFHNLRNKNPQLKKWEGFKTDDKIKKHVRTHFPFKRQFFTDSFLAKIQDGSFFCYVQCNLVLQDELKSKAANFLPIFKNTEVGRNDIGDCMKKYAIANEILKHPQRVLISSFKPENGTLLTPLFISYI